MDLFRPIRFSQRMYIAVMPSFRCWRVWYWSFWSQWPVQIVSNFVLGWLWEQGYCLISYALSLEPRKYQEIDLHHSLYSTELGTGRFAPFLSSGPLFVFGQWEGWMRRRHKKDLGCRPKYMLNIYRIDQIWDGTKRRSWVKAEIIYWVYSIYSRYEKAGKRRILAVGQNWRI